MMSYFSEIYLARKCMFFSFSLNFQLFYKSVFVVKPYKSSMINSLTAPLNCKITWVFLNTTDGCLFSVLFPRFKLQSYLLFDKSCLSC